MAPSRPRSLRALAFGSSKRSSEPGPPSPTFSESTHVSAMNFGAGGPKKIITRSNLKASLQAYEDLMASSANYRMALIAMSKATAAFADAMERCSGLKGPTYEASTRLQAASGVHHLIGNHWHVLAETLDRNFEKPLRQHLDSYRTIVTERSLSYERALREKSQIIRDTEMRNLNRKERNLQSFREALTVLQRQVDELDDLKASHYQEIIEHEEEVWEVVEGKVCIVVRSTMDVFDRFTAKASDPIIEPMLQSVPDPFDSYGPPQAEDQIFSILAPLSIMTSTPSASPSPMTGTPLQEGMDGLPTSAGKNSSWATHTNSGGFFPAGPAEWAESPLPSSTPPRSISPPSLPTRRHSIPSATHNPRKSDSKLRTILPVIDETNLRHSSSDGNVPSDNMPSAQDNTPQSDTASDPSTSGWSFTYGRSPYDNADSDPATPRNSTLFSPQLTPLPPDPDAERKGSDETLHIPVAT
ncbi:hypothetical protein BD779DRAFT_1490107 [Infundibulicybe gibba]|nr:hypothetical protein BD779DRAFT_1490107 [Infundibulicybe gibba]